MALGLGTTVIGGSIPVAAATANLSWSAPSAGPSVTGYNIYKSTDGGTTYSLLDTTASTSATVSADAGDKIKVVAYNGAGESDDSNVVTIT